MKNKKSTRGQKTVFVGDKPSPQKNYPTPGEQIANLIMDDVAKGNIEEGAAYIKKQAKMDGNIEKESDYIRKSMGVPYDIEDFIERGFW